jgi:hypothetical protein
MLEQARKEGIADRKFRNQQGDKLFLFNKKPSASTCGLEAAIAAEPLDPGTGSDRK